LIGVSPEILQYFWSAGRAQARTVPAPARRRHAAQLARWVVLRGL